MISIKLINLFFCALKIIREFCGESIEYDKSGDINHSTVLYRLLFFLKL